VTSFFRLPGLGEGLSDATIVKWLVRIGDWVAIDQPIVEIETSKTILQLPCPYEGVVVALHGTEGATVTTGTPLIELAGTTDADADRRMGQATSEISQVDNIRSGRSRSPRGRGGQMYAAHQPARGGTFDQKTAAIWRRPAGLEVVRQERLSLFRQAVGEKTTKSRQTIPEVTLWVDVDASNLWKRHAIKSSPFSPSITALVGQIVLQSLANYPALASRLSEDGLEIVEFDGVNLGIATATPAGVMVPAVVRADRMSLRELDDEIRSLTGRSKSGGTSSVVPHDSTFTLNNYGGFRIDGSAAIINAPEVAMLGIGRVLERPWVTGGRMDIRHIAQLSLVFDHRVCDGAYAAGFLNSVAHAVEEMAAEE